jgi:hypothetical protein
MCLLARLSLQNLASSRQSNAYRRQIGKSSHNRRNSDRTYGQDTPCLLPHIVVFFLPRKGKSVRKPWFCGIVNGGRRRCETVAPPTPGFGHAYDSVVHFLVRVNAAQDFSPKRRLRTDTVTAATVAVLVVCS